MAQFTPIRGIRYTQAAGTLSQILAPPYDVITPEEQRALLEGHPYNSIHLEFAAGDVDRYEATAETLASWLREGIVERDAEPMLYAYEQEFEALGKVHRRRALIAGVEAQPWEEGAVLPHEYTMSGPKEDRMRLLEATGVQFSPVFMIARDRAGQLRDFLAGATASKPTQEGRTSEGRHRLWAVPAGRFEMRQLAPLLAESFYIADGHHRYETAVAFKLAELRKRGHLEQDHPTRFTLAAVVAADDPGLVVRPIHRVVSMAAPADWHRTLGENFAISTIPEGEDPPGTAATLLVDNPDALVVAGLERAAFTVLVPLDPSTIARLTPPEHSELWANILPNVVRYALLEPLWGISDDDLRAGAVVEYVHDEHEAYSALSKSPGASVAVMINPVSVHDVIALADRGERMPQKSTFFFPKLGTGLVFHPLYP